MALDLDVVEGLQHTDHGAGILERHEAAARDGAAVLGQPAIQTVAECFLAARAARRIADDLGFVEQVVEPGGLRDPEVGYGDLEETGYRDRAIAGRHGNEGRNPGGSRIQAVGRDDQGRRLVVLESESDTLARRGSELGGGDRCSLERALGREADLAHGVEVEEEHALFDVQSGGDTEFGRDGLVYVRDTHGDGLDRRLRGGIRKLVSVGRSRRIGLDVHPLGDQLGGARSGGELTAGGRQQHLSLVLEVVDRGQRFARFARCLELDESACGDRIAGERGPAFQPAREAVGAARTARGVSDHLGAVEREGEEAVVGLCGAGQQRDAGQQERKCQPREEVREG